MSTVWVSTGFHTTKRVLSALACLMPESIIFYAGKNLIPYEITLYVKVAERPLDGGEMEVSLLLIRRTSYYCTDFYPAISFLILFLTIRKKY